MSRNFMYVHERIYKEQNAMEREFQKLAVNGRKTSPKAQKEIEAIINASSYVIAKECGVLVSYPRHRVEGRKVVLGEALIMLPNCRLVSIEKLRDIETGNGK